MTGRQSMSSDHTGGLYSTDAEHGFRALRQEIVCMRQQPLRLAVAAARAAGRRLALTGGPERRPRRGSRDRLRFRAGRRSPRRSWPRSRARAGFESSSGIPPLGGFEGDGGGHGRLPPPSSESESDCPGDGPRRPRTIGRNITARTSPRYTSPRMLTPPICGALGMVQSLAPDRSCRRGSPTPSARSAISGLAVPHATARGARTTSPGVSVRGPQTRRDRARDLRPDA